MIDKHYLCEVAESKTVPRLRLLSDDGIDSPPTVTESNSSLLRWGVLPITMKTVLLSFIISLLTSIQSLTSAIEFSTYSVDHGSMTQYRKVIWASHGSHSDISVVKFKNFVFDIFWPLIKCDKKERVYLQNFVLTGCARGAIWVSRWSLWVYRLRCCGVCVNPAYPF